MVDLNWSVGDISSDIPSEASQMFPAAYRPFIVPVEPDKGADLSLRFYRRPGYDVEVERPLFDVKELWSLGYWRDQTVIKRYAQGQLLEVVLLGPDMRSGEVYRVGEELTGSGRFSHPLIYPLDMLIYVNLLSQGRGALFHAAGVIDQGAGRIFIGHSAAGKSTISRLWQARDGVTLLNDDRILARQHAGRFCMYGTPWHGEIGIVAPQSSPIEGIYLLKHADHNRLSPLRPAQAVAQILSCTITTFWDARGMEFTIRFLDELVQKVPCFELGFVPDSSVVDFLQWQKF
jgi:hypothetical protein